MFGQCSSDVSSGSSLCSDSSDTEDYEQNSHSIRLNQVRALLLLRRRRKQHLALIMHHIGVQVDNPGYEGDCSVNPDKPKTDLLTSLIEGHSSRFRNVTGFTFVEWDELCDLVKPVVAMHSRSTGEIKIKKGRPSKLSIEERILSCLLLLKHVMLIFFMVV